MSELLNDLMHLGWNEDEAWGRYHVSQTLCRLPVHRARVGGAVTCLVCLARKGRWDPAWLRP